MPKLKRSPNLRRQCQVFCNFRKDVEAAEAEAARRKRRDEEWREGNPKMGDIIPVNVINAYCYNYIDGERLPIQDPPAGSTVIVEAWSTFFGVEYPTRVKFPATVVSLTPVTRQLHWIGMVKSFRARVETHGVERGSGGWFFAVDAKLSGLVKHR